MQKSQLVNKALSIEELDTTFLFFDDFQGFGAGPGEAFHKAEWHSFGAKAAARVVQVFHRQFQTELELVVQGQAVGVFFRSVAVWVHVVPDKMPNEGESITEPHHGFVEVVGVVGTDDCIDIGRDAHVRYMAQGGHQGFPGTGIGGDVVVYFRSIAVQRHVNVAQPMVHTFLEELFSARSCPLVIMRL